MIKRVIHMKVLPGEPTDGSGKVCIHLFVPDPKGTFVESCVLYPKLDDSGNRIGNQLVNKPTRGRLACDPKRSAVSVTVKNVTTVTPRTDDHRAVTCPRCIASRFYTDAVSTMERLLSEATVCTTGPEQLTAEK